MDNSRIGKDNDDNDRLDENVSCTKRMKIELDRSMTKDNQELYEELVKVDPEMAKRFHPNNRRKIIRWVVLYLLIDRFSFKMCKYVFGLEGNCISKVMFRLNWKITDLNFRWNNFWYQKINIFFNFKRKKKNCCFMLINSKYNFFFY